ncbi:APA family fibronectin-binding glycoprotein [Nocardia sp. NBC_01388]|uniref:APA family fibronectin-binding glycoprotein n=1 Tax=Nocardia sp. NBC_01388 TaxID=2903596 RepID=UPI00324D8BCF
MEPNQVWPPEPAAALPGPDVSEISEPTVSPRIARGVIALCVVALVASLAGIGYSAFLQLRRSHAEANRTVSRAAGLSFVTPDGWQLMPQESDDEHLVFGQVALQRSGGGDGMILLGKLDRSLFAAAESDDTRAACALGSGMGEFFFPDSGKRVDTETLDLEGREVAGESCFYRISFDTASSPEAEIYSAVVQSGDRRWWVSWIGDAKAPVDKAAAEQLAESIRPL